MSNPLKRKLSSTIRSVSPPAVRRKPSPSTRRPVSTPPTPPNILTLFSWNVNSIQPLLQNKLAFVPNPITPLRSFLHHHHYPTLLAFQEVKISAKDLKTQRLVTTAANLNHAPDTPTYATHLSLPRDKHNATGFGGKVHGVATLVRDDAPHCVTTIPPWDLEGRVLIHDFTTLNLVVVNGYWINGTTNPYRDPKTGEVSGTRHDHKLRFHGHMLALCEELEARGKSVLLLGDMNIAPTRIDGHPNLRTSPIQHVHNRADFNGKFLGGSGTHNDRCQATDAFDGVDLFRHFHGQEKRFTYHGRGRPWGESCDRVDLTIASRQMVDKGCVVASDICDTPADRGHSDHVPIWVSLDVSKLLGESEVESADVQGGGSGG